MLSPQNLYVKLFIILLEKRIDILEEICLEKKLIILLA
jgi:hypothetical protein